MENNSNIIDHDIFLGISTKVTLYSILLVWSLVGNVLVIAVVYWNLDLRTNFNYLIVNMAISDLIIPLVAIPLRISQLTAKGTNDWFVDGQLGNILCKLSFFLADVSPVVSVVSLVIIAINRYIAVSYTVSPRLSRRVINRILLAFTWLVAIALFSPYLVTWHTTKKDGVTKCVNGWYYFINEDGVSFSIFIGIVVLVSFIIPSICIVILYSLIIYKLHESSRNISTMLHNQQRVNRKRKNKQITYISLLIMIAFICLWGPFYVFLSLIQIVWQWNIPPDISAKIEFISFVITYLAFSNSAMNPSIYFFCLKNYRHGLKCLLGRVRTRRNSQTFETRTNRSFKLRNQMSMRYQQRSSIQMMSTV